MSETNNHISRRDLGFCDPPGNSFVFVATCEVDGTIYPWYSLVAGGKGERIPFKKTAMVGFLHKVELVAKRHHKKPKEIVFKLRFYIEANRSFILQFGATTVLSRGWLLSLNAVKDLAKPLYFCVRVGQEESKTILGSIHFWSGERVKVDYQSDKPLFPIVQGLQEKLGLPVQTKKKAIEKLIAQESKNRKQNY